MATYYTEIALAVICCAQVASSAPVIIGVDYVAVRNTCIQVYRADKSMRCDRVFASSFQ